MISLIKTTTTLRRFLTTTLTTTTTLTLLITLLITLITTTNSSHQTNQSPPVHQYEIIKNPLIKLNIKNNVKLLEITCFNETYLIKLKRTHHHTAILNHTIHSYEGKTQYK